MRETLQSRIERQTFPEPNTGCHLWAGCVRSSLGYGVIKIKRKMKFVHRVNYELANGPIPNNLFACHRCDNPACVNPDHLFLGTALDNAKDRDSKGRGVSGERQWLSKLNSIDVKIIREAIGLGFSQTTIGKYFRVTSWTIRDIKNNRSWTHLI